MEIFRNTNYDFLGKKWWFIGASVVMMAVGLVSLAVKGGPRYGIDFKGGALMTVKWAGQPPVERIRAALGKKIQGEITVYELTDVTEPAPGGDRHGTARGAGTARQPAGHAGDAGDELRPAGERQAGLQQRQHPGAGGPAARTAAAGRRGAVRPATPAGGGEHAAVPRYAAAIGPDFELRPVGLRARRKLWYYQHSQTGSLSGPVLHPAGRNGRAEGGRGVEEASGTGHALRAGWNAGIHSVSIRVDLWRRGRAGRISRYAHNGRTVFSFQQGDYTYGHRGAVDAGRLLDERYDRDFRPDPRESEADAARAARDADEHQYQPDAEPDGDDLGPDVSDGAGAVPVRRPGVAWIFVRAGGGDYRRELLDDLRSESAGSDVARLGGPAEAGGSGGSGGEAGAGRGAARARRRR